MQEKAFQENVRHWIETHKDEMLRDLTMLVNIPSVSDSASGIAPFGQGCRDAVDAFLELGKKYGFETRNYEYYVAEIRMGNAEHDIGLWTHLDVVPVGEGWLYEPFSAVQKGNYLIGRGAQDNKGPAIAMLYVMRCLRDLGIEMKHSIRLFAGTNEEKGMADMDYYTKRYACPEFSLVPDSGFPVCYGERGAFDFAVTTDKPVSDEFPAVYAGEVRTMIPETARADFTGCAGAEAFLRTCTEPPYSVEGKVLTAHGISRHAMSPDGAISPLGLLARVLLSCSSLSETDRSALEFLQDACSDFQGTALGLACADEESGPLICAATMLRLEPDRRLTFEASAKFPVSMRCVQLEPLVREACAARGCSVNILRAGNPNYYNRDHPAVQRLTEVYNRVMGTAEKPFIMSGGTYARKIPRAVAFGTGMPVEPLPLSVFPKGHGDFHQPDEALDLTRQLRSMEIYALGLAAIDDLTF